jgi:hypothetical protein
VHNPKSCGNSAHHFCTKKRELKKGGDEARQLKLLFIFLCRAECLDEFFRGLGFQICHGTPLKAPPEDPLIDSGKAFLFRPLPGGSVRRQGTDIRLINRRLRRNKRFFS